MWDLVSCFFRRVECFILKGKSRSGSFQKKKSESRGGACLLFRKALHVYAFGWHRKSCKILISRSAGVTDFFGERKCLSRKWSFCRGRTLDSKHEVRSRCRRAWPRSHVFYKFLVPPKSPKTTNFEIPGRRICTQFFELIYFCYTPSQANHSRKSHKILIFGSAGLTDFFGERKCLSRKWSFCRGRTLDSNMLLQEVVVLSRQNARFHSRNEVVGDASLASKSCVL